MDASENRDIIQSQNVDTLSGGKAIIGNCLLRFQSYRQFLTEEIMNKIEQAIVAILSTSLSDRQKQQALLLVCASEQNQTQAKQPTKNPPQDTFVYLIENEQGHIKIGFSGNPEKRLSQLKTACPSAVLLHKFKGTIQKDIGQAKGLFGLLDMLKKIGCQ